MLAGEKVVRMTVGRVYAVILSVGMALAICSPLHPRLRGVEGDNFPLSWYPMFSRPREEIETLTYVIGLEQDRTRHIIHYSLYSPGGMNSARHHIRDVARSRKAGRATCKHIAKGVAARQKGPLSRVRTVMIVRGKYRLAEYFGNGNKQPISEVATHTCTVNRESPSRETPDDLLHLRHLPKGHP
jgi:hypothetical protein